MKSQTITETFCNETWMQSMMSKQTDKETKILWSKIGVKKLFIPLSVSAHRNSFATILSHVRSWLRTKAKWIAFRLPSNIDAIKNQRQCKHEKKRRTRKYSFRAMFTYQPNNRHNLNILLWSVAYGFGCVCRCGDTFYIDFSLLKTFCSWTITKKKRIEAKERTRKIFILKFLKRRRESE